MYIYIYMYKIYQMVGFDDDLHHLKEPNPSLGIGWFRGLGVLFCICV